MKRALVILGDSEFASAIIGGVKSNEQQLIPVNASHYKEDVRKSIRYATGCRDWCELYYNMIYTYGFPEDYHAPNIICQKLLLAWALMWAGIFECYRRLSAWNRQA